MGRTTLSIDEQTKERLDLYRHPDHNSWAEQLNGMMEMLPSIEDIQEDGCVNCGETPHRDAPTEDIGGVVRFFYARQEDLYGANYFCCPECAKETTDKVQAQIPREPDLVVVGGHEELRTEFTGATFYFDGRDRQVGLDIPGAFGGTDSFGEEYDYIGEPVYLKNEGQWVQKGVIEDIYHEETHTGLDLGYDMETTMLNHPDEEAREEYKEQHCEWADYECPSCESELRVIVEELPDVCPECDEQIEADQVSE